MNELIDALPKPMLWLAFLAGVVLIATAAGAIWALVDDWRRRRRYDAVRRDMQHPTTKRLRETLIRRYGR